MSEHPEGPSQFDRAVAWLANERLGLDYYVADEPAAVLALALRYPDLQGLLEAEGVVRNWVFTDWNTSAAPMRFLPVPSSRSENDQ